MLKKIRSLLSEKAPSTNLGESFQSIEASLTADDQTSASATDDGSEFSGMSESAPESFPTDQSDTKSSQPKQSSNIFHGKRKSPKQSGHIQDVQSPQTPEQSIRSQPLPVSEMSLYPAKTFGSVIGRHRNICYDIAHYPKAVFFMLGNEFCERFSFYGLRSILYLYLITVHKLSTSNAGLVFHAFGSVAHFSPLIGSFIADGCLGKFKLGNAGRTIDYIGLFIVAIASGSIKPCVAAFAADQFPETMGRERAQFFSFFYFMINAGALSSKLVTPAVRGGYSCLGEINCFPLAFGIPGVFMIVATVIFLAGSRYYTIYQCSGENILCQMVMLIFHALRNRFKGKRKRKCKLLDYADDKYSKTLIADTHNLVKISVLFIPVIFFWALFDQQGSTWLLQARRMNGRVGHLTILPDQMAVLNPLMILIFVPIFEAVFYPLLGKCYLLKSSLERMAAGGILAALSFIIAGVLQLKVNKTMIRMPEEGYRRFGVQNMLDCDINLLPSGDIVPGRSSVLLDFIMLTHIRLDDTCNITETKQQRLKFNIKRVCDPHTACLVSILRNENSDGVDIFEKSFDLNKINGHTQFIVVASKSLLAMNASVRAVLKGASIEETKLVPLVENGTVVPMLTPLISNYNQFHLYLHTCTSETSCEDTLILENFEANMGALYGVLLVHKTARSEPLQLIPPNSLSILWMIPQYVVLSFGEIFFSITGLEFSYSQAAPALKSVVQAIWLMTIAFGNVIDVIISGSHMVSEPSVEFFIYAGLMGAVMIIFISIAYFYKPVYYGHINLSLKIKSKTNNSSTAHES